jgi:EAL domain-containing protein (putative c-di-GMP-specific phosphodiesterase class I)
MTANDGTARAYRLGGDQFVLLMHGCGNPLVASEVIQSVLDRLSQKLEINGHELFVTASAGFAIAPADGSDIDSLLANADLALSDAKASGGRRIRKFMPTMRAKAESRRMLDHELRRAWRDKEFALYFQPQVRSSDQTVAGAEALLRWHHPQRGVLAPGAFIEALAENAISLEVGRWVLSTACQSAASWRAKGLGDLRIAVNLFPVHFRHSTLIADVKDALRESGLPPEALELEITENIALSQDESLIAPLKELRTMGVGIAFDDFGTGYASLSCLTSYPLSRIKIDRSFVQTVVAGAPEEQSAIVRSILAMARNLKLDVTAEGVETTVQADFLRAANCQELQGYLFSKPVPSDAFENFLAARKANVQLAS